MATAEQPLAGLPHASQAVSTELADQWRKLTRAATVVANAYEREARRAVESTR